MVIQLFGKHWILCLFSYKNPLSSSLIAYDFLPPQAVMWFFLQILNCFLQCPVLHAKCSHAFRCLWPIVLLLMHHSYQPSVRRTKQELKTQRNGTNKNVIALMVKILMHYVRESNTKLIYSILRNSPFQLLL